MNGYIFLSHNYNDKNIVEPFANRLASRFGRDKVFYDSWSIQPGDGIIDKMNLGLAKANYFFFFISENSLKSKMVKLEWQNALLKAVSGEIRFIPIRLDQSPIPTILSQTLYLDLYTNGFEAVLRQMVDIICGENTYHSTENKYHNVKVDINRISDKEYDFAFFAETYMEPISNYAIVVDNSEEDIKVTCLSDPMFLSGFNKDAVFYSAPDGNRTYSAIAVSVQRATAPGFPIKVKVQSKSNLNYKGVLRASDSQNYIEIPFRFIH